MTSLYCNKEGIQFVKYHQTACILHQIIELGFKRLSQVSVSVYLFIYFCKGRWNGLIWLARRYSDKHKKRERNAARSKSRATAEKKIYAF